MEGIAGFDWDEGNRAKCTKHGVSIAEIEGALSDNPVIAPDIKHSDAEDRYIAIGRDRFGRPMFVAFVYRARGDRRLIRPISARYMHRREAERYEKKGSETAVRR